MKLKQKKNITASIYVDDVNLIEHDSSKVYAKISKNNDEIFLCIKNPQSKNTIKLHFKPNTKS